MENKIEYEYEYVKGVDPYDVRVKINEYSKYGYEPVSVNYSSEPRNTRDILFRRLIK